MGDTVVVAGGFEEGREAFERQAWGDAFRFLSAAEVEQRLAVDDSERLAVAAYLVGRSEESAEAWTRAHLECVRLGDVARAARCAFWLAFGLLNRGDLARGGGWVDRAQRLLDDAGLECVEQGYLRYPVALRAIFEGDGATAHAAFTEAAEIGSRFDDTELVTLARVGVGRCLIYMGEVAERGWRCSTRPWWRSLLVRCRRSRSATCIAPSSRRARSCSICDGCTSGRRH